MKLSLLCTLVSLAAVGPCADAIRATRKAGERFLTARAMSHQAKALTQTRSQSNRIRISYGEPLPKGNLSAPRPEQEYTVCLTTVPWRAGHIQGTVDSLLDQKPLGPSQVVLTVPTEIRGERLNEDDLLWTQHARYHRRLLVHRADNDFGPATKLMGCLSVIPQEEDKCLVVTDDDMTRPSHWAQLLLHQHRCTADNARVAGGFLDGPIGDEMFEHMVHGYRGWAVHRSHISFPKLHAFWEHYRRNCFFVDDEMFTGYLRENCLAIDILYSSDASHRVPTAPEIISDDSMHNNYQQFKGLSGSANTGGSAKAQACRQDVERERKTQC